MLLESIKYSNFFSSRSYKNKITKFVLLKKILFYFYYKIVYLYFTNKNLIYILYKII